MSLSSSVLRHKGNPIVAQLPQNVHVTTKTHTRIRRKQHANADTCTLRPSRDLHTKPTNSKTVLKVSSPLPTSLHPHSLQCSCLAFIAAPVYQPEFVLLYTSRCLCLVLVTTKKSCQSPQPHNLAPIQLAQAVMLQSPATALRLCAAVLASTPTQIEFRR